MLVDILDYYFIQVVVYLLFMDSSIFMFQCSVKGKRGKVIPVQAMEALRVARG
jgi:hypothetical protein